MSWRDIKAGFVASCSAPAIKTICCVWIRKRNIWHCETDSVKLTNFIKRIFPLTPILPVPGRIFLIPWIYWIITQQFVGFSLQHQQISLPPPNSLCFSCSHPFQVGDFWINDQVPDVEGKRRGLKKEPAGCLDGEAAPFGSHNLVEELVVF